MEPVPEIPVRPVQPCLLRILAQIQVRTPAVVPPHPKRLPADIANRIKRAPVRVHGHSRNHARVIARAAQVAQMVRRRVPVRQIAALIRTAL